jgi:hypothetical protein
MRQRVLNPVTDSGPGIRPHECWPQAGRCLYGQHPAPVRTKRAQHRKADVLTGPVLAQPPANIGWRAMPPQPQPFSGAPLELA